MIPELGHFALVLALCMALVQGIVPLAGAQRRASEWMAVAAPAARAQALFVAVSFACLVAAFVTNDFSVEYVALNSNRDLPIYYRMFAVWGSHEGSLLLWALILAAWTVAVTYFSRGLTEVFAARVIAVMGLISVGFLLFMLATSNPFERLLPAAAEGRDLNPLLQDPAFVIHPPMLYMGYVGMAVPFAFAIAALLEGRVDAAWTRWTRPWTTLAWVFLTLGIALGSWWAYYELGWGGWWFWDPVENASFMPWLVATALIHSLAVTEQRGAFRAWTVLLAIFAFALSLLGTFLVRSGVLVSVHAFATDPARGVFILAFLAVVVGGALALYAWRAAAVAGGGQFQLLSRETLLLANNVLLVVACATVLLGTLYPLVLDALGLGKISVGPPYFDNVFVPLMLPLIVLVGVGPLARWKRDEPRRLVRSLRVPLALAALTAALCLALLSEPRSVWTVVSLSLAVWVFASTVRSVIGRVRAQRIGVWAGLRRLPRSFAGMSVAHAGVAVFMVGVAMVGTFGLEDDVRLAPGAAQALGGYEFRFQGVRSAMGPNYRAQRGEIEVLRDGRPVATLRPEKRFYPVQPDQPMTEAAIEPGVTRDLYVALGEPLGGGDWAVRLYVKPFVRWIWFGALLMAVGGILAASDRRYRLGARAEARAAAEAPAPGGPLAGDAAR